MMSSVRSSCRYLLPVLMLALLASHSLADVTGSARELYGKCFGPVKMGDETIDLIKPTGEECHKPFRVTFKVHVKPDTDGSEDYVKFFFRRDFNWDFKGTGPQLNYKIGTCSFSLNVTQGHDNRDKKFTIPEIGPMEIIDPIFYVYRDRIVFDAYANGIPTYISGCMPFKDFDNRELAIEQHLKDGTQPAIFLTLKHEYTVEWISADYIDKPTTSTAKPTTSSSTQKPATTSSNVPVTVKPTKTAKPTTTSSNVPVTQSTQKPAATSSNVPVTEPIAEPSKDDSDNVIPTTEPEAGNSLLIIIGSISGLLLLLLSSSIVIAIIVIRRRRKKPVVKPEGDEYDQQTVMSQATTVDSQMGGGLRIIAGNITGATTRTP